MAVLCGLSRWVLWISCLLTSSVTCLPARKGYGSADFSNPAPGGYMRWSSPYGSNFPREYYTALAATVDLEPIWNDASGVSSGSGNAGVGPVATGSSSSNSGSTGGDGGYMAFSSEGEEEPSQAVFSPVSDMEPVYIFRARSGYRNGRLLFSKTRYTPGEIVFPPRPFVERIPKPVSVSKKGGQ